MAIFDQKHILFSEIDRGLGPGPAPDLRPGVPTYGKSGPWPPHRVAWTPDEAKPTVSRPLDVSANIPGHLFAHRPSPRALTLAFLQRMPSLRGSARVGHSEEPLRSL